VATAPTIATRKIDVPVAREYDSTEATGAVAITAAVRRRRRSRHAAIHGSGGCGADWRYGDSPIEKSLAQTQLTRPSTGLDLERVPH
jgi:hypothetical protein